MKMVLRTLGVLALLGAIGGGAVVGFGLYNVSAQVGHWPGVSWVLHSTFRNSVGLRAMPEDEVPDNLSDPAMIELGARHYDSACADCHSVPGEERTATMRAMLPAPPHIYDAVEDWEPNELHWIVYNGIKMSGMPAWPGVGREEEVWPVVAYLVAVQEGIEPEAQRALTEVGEDGPAGAGYCAGCHIDVDSHVPRLDILSADYIAAELQAYHAGDRESGIMEQAATDVPQTAHLDLAEYFAQTPIERPAGEGSAEGETLATRGSNDVPACTACHGPGQTEAQRFPSLSGQDEAYLATQLRLWRDGGRTGSEKMTIAAEELTDEEIDALAAWFASLEPAEGDEVSQE
ncbi:c-type cytochrome [Pelagovum pacificum]|uniref:C-type cytochrome n=1 Tax=Pelagovum pacificum TaxID=2588711 RepID=A0A5C5G9J1_9RHOB|nr:c-type cytochrome [Pelagovum pacificum]QQA41912.1 c-type cytochrome [Pelagovum pacificum]TNY30648.1 c-type cytochrome [Pelagovum pacificum]